MSDVDLVGEEELFDLAMGVLPPARASIVLARVDRSPKLRAELAAMREAFASIGEAAPAAAPAPAFRALVLGATQPETQFDGFVARLSRLFDLPENEVAAVLARVPHASSWERGPVPGVALMHFRGGPRTAEADTGFVRFDAGTVFPMHEHRGDEQTLYLAGSVRDDTGREWLPGDLSLEGPGSHHSLTVVGDEPCVSAIVLFGGLQLVR